MSAFPTWMIEGDTLVISAEHTDAALAALFATEYFAGMAQSGPAAAQLVELFASGFDTEAEVTPDGAVRIWHLFDETVIESLAEPFRAIAAFVVPGTVEFSCASDGEEGPEDFGEAFRFIFDGSPRMRITYRPDEDSGWEDWKSA
jgi:hypothetical protein